MAIRERIKAIRLAIQRANRVLVRRFVNRLFGGLLRLGRIPQLSRAGFVLPTTVLLLLVVTLTVGSIGYRTYTRTQQTIGERQQRVVYNAATPAVDRARSKLEFLFDSQRDSRLPGGVPPENYLLGMMLNRPGGTVIGDTTIPAFYPNGYDPYTFSNEVNPGAGERRVDINGDGVVDNAWLYRTDTNGDGTQDATVVYSIVFQTPPTEAQLRDTRNDPALPTAGVRRRAAALQVRNAPLSSRSPLTDRCATGNVASQPAGGWLPDGSNTSILRKNFQINAYVLPDNPNGTVATLEVQQDRQAERGNKWGAWFRNDLEIFPGPAFRMNGAMHSEGSLMVAGGSFTSLLISSPASCLYTADASEVTTVNVQAGGTRAAYQGQFIAGGMRDNGFLAADSGAFHIFNGANAQPLVGQTLTPATDSVTPNDNTGTLRPVDFAIDPIAMQTAGESRSRGIDGNPATQRAATWAAAQLAGGAPVGQQNARIRNIDRREPPYVDDSYRADNRYGPKPTYGRESSLDSTLRVDTIGTRIGNVDALVKNGDPTPGADTSDVGLDGYWERRARLEGMRVIVGQRLELGDPAGWGGPQSGDRTAVESFEPLRPYRDCTGNANRCAEARQRKSLWDNLASVQATAIYHAADSNSTDPDIPTACLATTVHPGTAGTLERSATFENLAHGFPTNAIPGYTDSNRLVISDFLRGRGTNGWSYVPTGTTTWTSWVDQFDDPNSTMMRALRNLAYFAGDPRGGAPSFRPIQDNFVHPYPAMAMWGDFSILRRVILLMDDGATYADLSPADKSTLHTAGCMIGMLAYNLDYLDRFNPTTHPLLGSTGAAPSGTTLRGAIEAIRQGRTPLGAFTNPQPRLDWMAGDPGALTTVSSNPEVYVRWLERWRDQLPAVQTTNSTFTTPAGVVNTNRETLNQIIYLAQMIISKEQVERDRFWGFNGSGDTINATREGSPGSPGLIATCGYPATDALRYLCSFRPRYPILYSLFPMIQSDVARVAPGAASVRGSHRDSSENTQRDLARDSIDSTDTYIALVNGADVTYEPFSQTDIASIALQPQPLTNWTIPVSGAVTPSVEATTANSNREDLIKVCLTGPCLLTSRGDGIPGEYRRVAFKDSAFFNGREGVSVRALNLDLGLLKDSFGGLTSDRWLPVSGVIYGFREDAVSEMSIVRPAQPGADIATCVNNANITANALCRMVVNVEARSSTDPPLGPRLISPKPVDYYPDPDRRPHGFRLRNGVRLDRTGDRQRGLSFITDNPVAIQGTFNLHQTSTGTRLEEFRTLLQMPDYTNFYARADVDNRFSEEANDLWRPAEILADGITVLSNNFCDGSIQDGILTYNLGGGATLPVATTRISQNESDQATLARYGCNVGGTRAATSYLNQNRPSAVIADRDGGADAWKPRFMRANPADYLSDAGTVSYIGDSPIVFSASGSVLRARANSQANTAYAGAYYAWSDGKSRNQAAVSEVNAIIISGIVPSRPQQSFGGLHNFPRFLEDWGGVPLRISGALLQLNYSNQATGPFDQDAWEPGSTPVAVEFIPYYTPPNRLWGYDVGLQKAPSGPVASRFAQIRPTRSEFYSEPPADDPYICRLRSAIGGAATCPT
jgi:hypothetical protein